jgi:hypothetical protein
MKRKIYRRLLDWKDKSKGTSALLIDGARRVGKSYIVKDFGREEYDSCMLIDFSTPRPGTIECFEKDSYDLDIFFLKLSVIYGVELKKRKSLVIFDEVQLYPPARQLIKHLVEDGRFDYIETGSLISLRRNVKDILIPSEEEHIEMFPMDFEEFLWALGDATTIPYLHQCFDNKTPLGQHLHAQIMNKFRTYMLVGGMPQAVQNYSDTKDFESVERIKHNILTLYDSDIEKYTGKEGAKVSIVYSRIPAQLSKHEKKYRLADIEKSARTREYESAFLWLEKSMIINRCFNATDPTVGLALSEDFRTQKFYMGDTGLLVSMVLGDDSTVNSELYKSVLLDKLNLNEGMLMENIVAQMLRANGKKLFFYSRSDSKERINNIEIDFLVSDHKRICPVEVKSSAYRKHSSLDKFSGKFTSRIGNRYILYQKDLLVKDGVIHLPIYLAMFL